MEQKKNAKKADIINDDNLQIYILFIIIQCGVDPHYIIINNIKYICLAIVSLLSAGFVQCANLLDLFGNLGKPVTLYKKFVGTAKEVFLSKKTTNILPEARGLESTIEDFKKRSDDLDNS